MSPPISVVVATHNRAERLERLIRALEGQDGPLGEVVIVDDCSTDRTWVELERLQTSTTVPLRCLRTARNSGAATARNVGWRATRESLVAFTDDDCVPEPGWLSAIAAALEGADLVQGTTLPDPEQLGNTGPFSRTISITHERGLYETCNMGYRRVVLEELDGFDERFRYPYGEDIDLAWRAKEQGRTSVFAADAVVFHDVWPSDFRSYLRDVRRREGLVLAFSLHPQLRGRFVQGVFAEPGHPLALVLVGLAVALLTRPASRLGRVLVVAAAVRYAWLCRRTHPKPARRSQWLQVVPQCLLVDLYELYVLARVGPVPHPRALMPQLPSLADGCEQGPGD